jgi:hypothetical protein
LLCDSYATSVTGASDGACSSPPPARSPRVNVPIGLAAIALTAVYVPESRAHRPRRLDPIGQLLVIVGLSALTFAIIEGPNAGWSSPQTMGVFALAAVSLIGLVPYELHRRDPLIEMRFFRSAPLRGRARSRSSRSPGSAASCS